MVFIRMSTRINRRRLSRNRNAQNEAQPIGPLPVDLAVAVLARIVTYHPLGHGRDTHGPHPHANDAVTVHLPATEVTIRDEREQAFMLGKGFFFQR